MNVKKFSVWLLLAFALFTACGDGHQAEQPLPTLAVVAKLEESAPTTDVVAESSLSTSDPIVTDSAETVATETPLVTTVTEIAASPTATIENNAVEPESTATSESIATVAPTALPPTAPASSASVGASNSQDQAPYRIAYVAFGVKAQQSQVRMMNPDGSHVRLLLDGLHIDTRILDWSVDGEWLLLSSGDRGTFALRMDGSQQMVPITEVHTAFGAISPVSTQAVVGLRTYLQLVDVATGETSDISLPLNLRPSEELPLPVGQLGNVAWSPDGTWFAFQLLGHNEANESVETLYRYTVADGTIEPLLTDAHFLRRMVSRRNNKPATAPLISPDGTQILTDLGEGFNLFTMPASGGELTTIWEGQLPIIDPLRWSPDGEWIAFIYDKDIFAVRADGQEWRQLTNTPVMEERHVQWSPDGATLIYAIETPRGVYELEQLDFNSGARQRLTTVTGTNTETVDVYPVPSPLLAPETLAQLDDGYSLLPADLLAPPVAEEADWIPYVASPTNLMEPPWWGSRFAFRRPIEISSEVAIDLEGYAQTQKPLVQLTFDSTLIQEQLEYPVEGLDVRVVWWDEMDNIWIELPLELNSMDAERTVITFPLQESVVAGETSGDYYLYYGSLARLYRWEEAPALEKVSLSETNLLDDRPAYSGWVGSFNSLAEGEAQVEVPSDASWVSGATNRAVVSVQASETVTMDFDMDLDQGTLSFMVKPTGNDGHIFSTVRDSDYSSSQPEPIYTPVLRYDGGTFQLTLRDGAIPFGATLLPNQWSHVTFTWLANEFARVYIDGVLIEETTYTPAPTTSFIIEQVPNHHLYSLLLGFANGESGLAGTYANIFSYGTSLDPTEVKQFYEAQQYVTLSLGDGVETAVNSVEIDAQTGGTILSPNGRLWIDIPPNALPASTTVSVADLNFSETDLYEMASIFVYPTEMSSAILGSNGETAVFEQFAAAADAMPLNKPLRYYFAYDPDFVEYLDKVYFIRRNPDSEADQSWFYFQPQVFIEDGVMGVEMDGWGRLLVIKEQGFVPERSRVDVKPSFTFLAHNF